MRGLYGARRAALAEALADTFGNRLTLGLQSGGMHLLARPAQGILDTELVRLAEARGLAPSPLSLHAIAADSGPGLLLSFTNIPESQAGSVARALWAAIGDRLG